MDDVTIVRLETRVHRLERLLVGGYAAIVAALLALGLLVPFATDRVGEDDEYALSVISFLGSIGEVREPIDFAGILLLTGFIGLLIVALLLIGTVIAAGRGLLSDRWRRISRILAALGIIGAVVVVIFSFMAGSNRFGDFGFGGLVLLAGMLGVLPLLSDAAEPLVSTDASAGRGGAM